MGDRIAFGFRAEPNKPESTIWLYAHWSGAHRYDHVRNALVAARPRWNDSSYATRIAISQIVGESWNDEHGFGISVGQDCGIGLDYDHVLVVNWHNRTVTVEVSGEVLVEFGFEVFLATVQEGFRR